MAKNERFLYQLNHSGYLCILFFIAANILYSILALNHMTPDYKLGLFIFVTIILLFTGFLSAVKVQTYSLKWSFADIVIGIFQLSRIAYTPTTAQGVPKIILYTALVLSALSCILGGAISIKNCHRFEQAKNMYFKESSG
ncbi:MAG: hypothetical protein MJB14_21905 [Spirochaetes bacterium]|nr:hypothetical protein [Spirochaetota bacterium]